MSPTQEEIDTARRRFVAWLRWYMDTHPDEIPSQAQLARSLGVTPPAVTYLFSPKHNRLPSFETMLAARKLLGMPLDVLLDRDPPPYRRR